MKKRINSATMILVVLGIIAGAPFTGFATDMWNETPALMHETKIESTATEPAVLKYVRPKIDMWAETPDYLAINKDSNITIEDELYVVYDINPEMYAETPDLRAEAAFPTL